MQSDQPPCRGRVHDRLSACGILQEGGLRYPETGTGKFRREQRQARAQILVVVKSSIQVGGERDAHGVGITLNRPSGRHPGRYEGTPKQAACVMIPEKSGV